MPRPRRWLPRVSALLPYGWLALAGAVVVPVFARGLPCSDDGTTHLARALQLSLNVSGGAPWLAWAPDLMRGYGYPIFAFYAPLTYWLIVGLHALGLSLVAAERAWLCLAVLGAGWSAYTLARRFLTVPAAFVAGLAYLFAPYLLYDAIQRGALPESLALAWLPLFLAAVVDAVRRPSQVRLLFAAGAFAVPILLHNLIPLMALPLVAAMAWATIPDREPADAGLARRGRHWFGLLWPVAASLLLGLGLTSGYWLPSLIELRDTLSGRAAPPPPELSDWPRYEQSFVPLNRIVGWPAEPGDPALLNAPVTRVLGIGQVAVAGLAVLSLVRHRDPQRRRFVVSLALLAVAAAWLASSASRFVWDAVPPLQAIQLPTRWLGLASLAAALLCGAGTQSLLGLRPGPAWQAAALGLPAVAVAVSGWPWLQPRYCPVAEPLARAQLANALDDSRWMIEPLGELAPRWVEALPPADALMPQYATGQPVNRLSWPDGSVTLLDWSTRPGFDAYTLSLAAPARLLYQSFYFPGWHARLDRHPLAIDITVPTGLIALELPAGEHHLEVGFQRTPVRWLGLGLSALTGLACLLLLFTARPLALPRAEPVYVSVPLTPLAGLTLLLLLLYFGGVQRFHSPVQARRWQSGRLAGVSVATGFDFAQELRHLGYTLSPAAPAPGDQIFLTQYWSALTDLGVPYGMDLRVVDEAGRVWSTATTRPHGYADFPGTESWPLDAYARDAYQFQIRPGTPPGSYWLETSVFRRDAEQALMPAPGVPTGANPAYARLGALIVTGVQPSVARADAAVEIYDPHPLAPGLTLTGWSPPAASLNSGDRAHVELLWSATSPQPAGLAARLELVGPDGAIGGTLPFTVGGDRYPAQAWSVPAVIRDQLDWRLKPALQTGSYTLQLSLPSWPPVPLGQFTLTTPARTFDRPSTAVELHQPLGLAALHGFTVSSLSPRPGEALTLDLAWQALAETEISYRVFVHLRDAAGAVRAQADGVPVGWTRPTTGWLPGEYLLDSYSLTVPTQLEPGTYDLVVGLYDPATGQRLGEAALTSLAID